MKVYVLTLENIKGSESVLGIFSTLEKAKGSVEPSHPHKFIQDWKETRKDFSAQWKAVIGLKNWLGTARLSYTISERWVI